MAYTSVAHIRLLGGTHELGNRELLGRERTLNGTRHH